MVLNKDSMKIKHYLRKLKPRKGIAPISAATVNTH